MTDYELSMLYFLLVFWFALSLPGIFTVTMTVIRLVIGRD